MTAAKFPLKTATSPQPLPESLPTMYDLPSEEVGEPGLPDQYHFWQAQLCNETFRPPTYPIDQVFAAGDLNLYYDPQHPRWYKRPDWFAVVGVSRLYRGEESRLSYAIWQEQVVPIIAMEFLSPSTQDEDLGQRPPTGPKPTKWQVYERILGIPYYFTFNRYTNELRVFQLEAGRYRQQSLQENRLWLPQLEIGLGLWQGDYCGLNRQWLRWYDEDGNWILTGEEQERLQKEAAEQAAAQERLQKEAAEQAVAQERLQKEAAEQAVAQERLQKEAAEQAVAQERLQKEAAERAAEQQRLQKEAAEQEKAAALQAQVAAEQRAAQLAQRLQQLGIDPDQL